MSATTKSPNVFILLVQHQKILKNTTTQKEPKKFQISKCNVILAACCMHNANKMEYLFFHNFSFYLNSFMWVPMETKHDSKLIVYFMSS